MKAVVAREWAAPNVDKAQTLQLDLCKQMLMPAATSMLTAHYGCLQSQACLLSLVIGNANIADTIVAIFSAISRAFITFEKLKSLKW